MKKPTNVPVPKTARTEQNKLARMARHAKRYPHTSNVPTAERRAMGRKWKAVQRERSEAQAARRAEFGTAGGQS